MMFFLAGFLVLNFVAWNQARSMTSFALSGLTTANPTKLTSWAKARALFWGITLRRPANHRTPADLGLSYSTHFISTRDGESLEAWSLPQAHSKGVVLLFHGYGVSKELVLPAAAAFHDLGYDALLVDFRGGGGSTGNDTSIGVHESRDVVSAVEFARKKWPGESVILFGTSMGSAAILRAIASEGLEPDAIVLESTFDRLINAVRSRFAMLRVPSWPGAELLLFWGSIQQRFNGFVHNPQNYAQSVRCPTLIMYGQKDPSVSALQTQSIFDNLRGRKELVGFPDAGHQLLVGVHSQLWKETVGGFFKEIEAGRNMVLSKAVQVTP